MKSDVLQKGITELSFLEEYGFKTNPKSNGIGFLKNTSYGFQSITFFERNIDQPELYCTVSIRFNEAENIINHYKNKHGLFNLEYGKETSTISVGLEKIFGKEIQFWADQSLTEQFEGIYKEFVIPFLENNSSLLGCWETINNKELILFIEPVKTYTRLVLAYLNSLETHPILQDWKNLNQESGMVRMYQSLFSDVSNQLENQLSLESLSE